MKKWAAIFFIMLFSSLCYAQHKNAKDSLLQLLSVVKSDTSKVLLLIDLSKASKNADISAAHQYVAEALSLSEKINFTRGRFLALINEISLIRIEGKDSLALIKCKSFLQLAERLKDSFNIAAGCLNLGEVYDNNGDNEMAVSYCLRGLGIAERLNKKSLLQDAYAALQRIYYSRSEFDKAIAYGQKAIALAKEMGDKNREMTQTYNLAFTYNINKEFEKSVSLSKDVISLAREMGDQRLETYALYNLCSVCIRQGKLEQALKYGNQCLEIAQKISDKSIYSSTLAALGSINLQLGKNKDAESYLLKALNLRVETEDKQGIADVKNMLANVYFALGEPVKAYSLEKESEEFSDAYNQSILKQQSSELEKKYETEKKNAQIKEQESALQKRKILNYLFASIALGLFLLSVFAYRNYRHRQNLQQAKINELETERQLSATAAVLKGEEQERTRLAKDLHDGLGGMLSGIKFSLSNMKENLIMTPDNAQAFERSIDMLDSSIKEMRRVAHNMMPEILVRYGLDSALNEFCNEITRSGVTNITYQSIGMKDKKMDQTTAVTIYRIVQELVNNAIKHAAAKNILVQAHASSQEKIIAITVEDDGKGFDKSILKEVRGMGWSNIQNRVDFLKGRIDVNSEKDKGTSVLIEINDAE